MSRRVCRWTRSAVDRRLPRAAAFAHYHGQECSTRDRSCGSLSAIFTTACLGQMHRAMVDEEVAGRMRLLHTL